MNTKLKFGFIILCRYNSSRLPGKILKQINKKPILSYIIERVSAAVGERNIIVATSNEKSDDPIEKFCHRNNINLFRGSLDNVAERFLECARQYQLNFASRINGDNFFLDIDTLGQMAEIARDDKFDFISNVKNRTFPKGMSIEIVRTTFYEKMYRQFNKDEHFEHVTLFLYQMEDQGNHFYFYNKVCPEAAGIQLAIDNQEDFDLAEKIILTFTKSHTEYGLKEIYNKFRMLTEKND